MTRGERDLGREPCPDRIVEDLGGAFGMGCVGGFLWHFVKGARNSPRGEIFSGALYSARTRAPVLGGHFAVWGGTFSCFDCSFQYLRGREDHWNAIASGFCTGGVLAMRGGWRSAARNAAIGGVLLSIIEMVTAVLSRKTTPTPRQQYQQQLEYEKMMASTQEANPQGSNLLQNGLAENKIAGAGTSWMRNIMSSPQGSGQSSSELPEVVIDGGAGDKSFSGMWGVPEASLSVDGGSGGTAQML